MDNTHSVPGNCEDHVGIPDDLRCKRSDGKQWRCTAMSMPDKTVCEKHYIQAKRRAANSALRASLRKGKRKSIGETDVYLDSRSDDFDVPLANFKVEDDEDEEDDDDPLPVSRKRQKNIAKNHVPYSPDKSPLMSCSEERNSLSPSDGDSQGDSAPFEENWRSSKTPPLPVMDSSRNRTHTLDANATDDCSGGSTDSSEEGTGAQTCHQCQRSDINQESFFWCLKCDWRGFCDSCISTWYPDIPFEEIEKVCPACRGICNCKACVRGDNTIKVRIREIPALDKLQYLYCLLSSVLPVIKKIHEEQCSEVELEKKIRGAEIDLVRTKLNADEQMCCNLCRIPIIDYHRHCSSCSYDLCLNCCRDLQAEVSEHQIEPVSPELKVCGRKLNVSQKFPDWKASYDGCIPCPPNEYGGCGYPSLRLHRIFKMNWVAKLVKNAEEMVNGCKIYNVATPQQEGLDDPTLCQCAHREDGDNNLYFPLSHDLKNQGVCAFRKHWSRGKPVIVGQVCDCSSISSWDPMTIWKGIRETTDEKTKDGNRMVKAINCSDLSEVEIELLQFIEGYSKGRIRENGCPEMLKLKDWPSPSASEEFLSYQRPEFISKLPLLEFIHSRLGLLNVAAKLPHYSLHNDAGPKVYISYGTNEELGRGDSVANIQINMRDLVYLLVHTHTVNHKLCESYNEKKQRSHGESEVIGPSLYESKTTISEGELLELSLGGHVTESDYGEIPVANKDNIFENHEDGIPLANEDEVVSCEQSKADKSGVLVKHSPGACWDVFRRQDASKIIQYLRAHCTKNGNLDHGVKDELQMVHPLFDRTIFLDGNHKRKLKEEFGVEPWTFEQQLGQAVFVPAGCPFQVKNLQSTVQLGLDFLSPESVGEAFRLAQDIRCLPNDHDAILQVLEIGKISLYAASFAIKEVQKLVLDPKLGSEIGFEDPNLTAMVSENLENLAKQDR